MVAMRYGISLFVCNSISCSFAALTRQISIWTLDEKFPALMYYSLFNERITFKKFSHLKSDFESLRGLFILEIFGKIHRHLDTEFLFLFQKALMIKILLIMPC